MNRIINNIIKKKTVSIFEFFFIFLNILYSSESQVMLLGGWYNGYLSLVEVYSIEEGFIAELPSMPTAR